MAAETVGKIRSAEGIVEIARGGVFPAMKAMPGDPVNLKDLIRTKSDSKAEVLFNDGVVLRLAQRTRIDVSEYMMESTGGIQLGEGKVEAVVPKQLANLIASAPGKNRFEIRTPNAVTGVRGTTFYVVYENTVTQVVVTEGHVVFSNPMQIGSVLVSAGNMSSVIKNNPVTPPAPIPPAVIEAIKKAVGSPDKPKDLKDAQAKNTAKDKDKDKTKDVKDKDKDATDKVSKEAADKKAAFERKVKNDLAAGVPLKEVMKEATESGKDIGAVVDAAIKGGAKADQVVYTAVSEGYSGEKAVEAAVATGANLTSVLGAAVAAGVDTNTAATAAVAGGASPTVASTTVTTVTTGADAFGFTAPTAEPALYVPPDAVVIVLSGGGGATPSTTVASTSTP